MDSSSIKKLTDKEVIAIAKEKAPVRSLRDRLRRLSFKRKKKAKAKQSEPEEQAKLVDKEQIDVYEAFEHKLKLSRLEEPQLLVTALRRRAETLDIEGIYGDFVKTHGRILFDHTQKWPLCHVHVRFP